MRIAIDTRRASAALEVAHSALDADVTIGLGIMVRIGRRFVYGRRWWITTAYDRRQRQALRAIDRLDLRPRNCAGDVGTTCTTEAPCWLCEGHAKLGTAFAKAEASFGRFQEAMVSTSEAFDRFKRATRTDR